MKKINLINTLKKTFKTKKVTKKKNIKTLVKNKKSKKITKPKKIKPVSNLKKVKAQKKSTKPIKSKKLKIEKKDSVESNDRPNVGSLVFDDKVNVHFSLFNNDDRVSVTSLPALIIVIKECEL